MSIRRADELKGRIAVATAKNHISREYSKDLLATMNAAGEHHGYEHARYRDWREDLRQKHKAFCIVRNPWARVVSRWTFWVVAAHNKRTTMPDGYTFEDFLEERHIYGGRKYYWHRAIRGWYQQLDHVGKCDVLRLEHLNDEATDYFKLKKPLNRRNISNGLLNLPKDYREYYDDASYQVIADWYKADIDHFGFSFDGSATRNTWTQ